MRRKIAGNISCTILEGHTSFVSSLTFNIKLSLQMKTGGSTL